VEGCRNYCWIPRSAVGPVAAHLQLVAVAIAPASVAEVAASAAFVEVVLQSQAVLRRRYFPGEVASLTGQQRVNVLRHLGDNL